MKVLSVGGLAVGHDLQSGQYFTLCPQCRERIACDTLAGLYHELIPNDRKCCQGCRARITLERNPGLVGLFLDFWCRTGTLPRSTSWLEAIPQTQFILWAKEIRAAFQSGETQGLQRFNRGSEVQKNEVKTQGAKR